MFALGIVVGFGIAWYASASRRLKKGQISPFFFSKIKFTKFLI